MSVVREKRHQAAMGQEELARKAGISVFKLSRIERGKEVLHVAEAILLADVLDCSPLQLLPELAEALADVGETRDTSRQAAGYRVKQPTPRAAQET